MGSPQVSNWNSLDLEPTVITTIPCSTYSMMGVLKFYIPIFKVLQQSQRPFTSLKLCKCSQNPHPASQHQILIKPTTIYLNICKHSKHTKLCYHARCCVRGRGRGLRGRNTRNKKWNLSTRQIGLTLVTNSRTIAHKSWMARCSPRSLGFQLKQ